MPHPTPSSAAVSARMSRQGSRDTAPEVAVRRLLHAAGLRYRLNVPVPGMPRRTIDITFGKDRIAVFMDGCFWHGCPQHATSPKSNAEWWRTKLDKNMARDHGQCRLSVGHPLNERCPVTGSQLDYFESYLDVPSEPSASSYRFSFSLSPSRATVSITPMNRRVRAYENGHVSACTNLGEQATPRRSTDTETVGMDMQMSQAYDQWCEVLSEEFFGASHALQNTVLYVDDDVERELAERHRIETPLTDAVSSRMHWGRSDRSLLHGIRYDCRLWASQGSVGPPPSLPVLAASVLAATRMAASDGMRRTNYRGRWYQLFGVPQEGHQANRLNQALDDVAAMWAELGSWLDEAGGLYGTSTVSTDKTFWRVGYPVSQALVRTSDRQMLTRFFATTRLRPRNATGVPGRELLRRLAVWSAGRGRQFSPRFMNEVRLASQSGKGDPLIDIAALLERLAADWDGTLHEPERTHRRKAAGLRLAVTERGQRLEWLADIAEGIDETTVQVHGGRSFSLRSDYGGVYSGLETLNPSEPQLRLGLRLEGSDLVIEWVPQEVVLLRMHPDLGEWVSTEYFEPGEHHWILASSAEAAKVRAMLASLDSRMVPEYKAPVPGWVLFKRVRAVDASAFTRTLNSKNEHTYVLQPQVRRDTKLVGGLRIAREYPSGSGVAGHYLSGAEPDLLLPAAQAPDGTVDVTLNGRTTKLKADPRVPFPLRKLSLEEGTHQVGTTSSSHVFTVHQGLHEGLPEETGSLGYKCGGTAAVRVSTTDDSGTWLRGAVVPETIKLPHSVIVRSRIQEAFFLDPYGGVVPVRGQKPPPWIRKRVPAAAAEPALEVEAPSTSVWFVYRTSQRWWVRAVNTDIPAPELTGEEYEWADVVRRAHAGGRCGLPAWARYVEAARAIGNEHDRGAV